MEFRTYTGSIMIKTLIQNSINVRWLNKMLQKMNYLETKMYSLRQTESYMDSESGSRNYANAVIKIKGSVRCTV